MNDMGEVKRDSKGRFIKGNKLRVGMRHGGEAKNKMSEARMGVEPWNKDKVGIVSDETREKMSNSAKKKLENPENHPFYGRKHSDESKKKMSDTRKELYKTGKITVWNKDLEGFRSGEENNMWKGDEASYSAIHKWVGIYKPKSKVCEVCDEKANRLELANLSGFYYRDIHDYMWMCVSCHRRFDDTMPTKFKTPRKETEELNRTSLHRRLRTKYPSLGFCQFCGKGTERLDLANLSGNYYPCIEDFIYLCRDCHAKFDKCE